MVVEVSTPDFPGRPTEDFERPGKYDCQRLGHIYSRWAPSSQTHVRRVCVIPGCCHVDSKKASA